MQRSVMPGGEVEAIGLPRVPAGRGVRLVEALVGRPVLGDVAVEAACGGVVDVEVAGRTTETMRGSQVVEAARARAVATVGGGGAGAVEVFRRSGRQCCGGR